MVTKLEKDSLRALFSRYTAHSEFVRFREGFSLHDFNRYLDTRGYRGIGYGRLKFADLSERAPLLVPISTSGMNSYAVFRGTIKDTVLLSDPFSGNTTMPRDDFEYAWLDYPNFGRVGFVVERRDGTAPANQLSPTSSAFIINIVGFGELIVTNANGEKIGFIDDKYIDEIHNAERFDHREDGRYWNIDFDLGGNALHSAGQPQHIKQPPQKSERK